jgi:RimJ/RimL family protein N-acetyltransferase
MIGIPFMTERLVVRRFAKKDLAFFLRFMLDPESNRCLGSCGFAHYDRGIVECYFCVNAEHRGRGIATEAVGALFAYPRRGRRDE